MPAEELLGVAEGRRLLTLALELLDKPASPGALTAARSTARKALGVIPQSKPDQLCHEHRWRGRSSWPERPPLEVCARPTCGRCVPLKQARASADESTEM